MASRMTRRFVFMTTTVAVSLALLAGLMLLYQDDMALHRRWFGASASFLRIETAAVDAHARDLSRMLVATGALPRSKSTGFHIQTLLPTTEEDTTLRLDVRHKYGIVPGSAFKGEIDVTRLLALPEDPRYPERPVTDETPLLSLHSLVQAEGTALHDGTGYLRMPEDGSLTPSDPRLLSLFPHPRWTLSPTRLEPLLPVTEGSMTAFLQGFAKTLLPHLAPHATHATASAEHVGLTYTHRAQLAGLPLEDALSDMADYLSDAVEPHFLMMLLGDAYGDGPFFPTATSEVKLLRYLHTRSETRETLHFLLEALSPDNVPLFRIHYALDPYPDGTFVMEWAFPAGSAALLGSVLPTDAGWDAALTVFRDGVPVKDVHVEDFAMESVTDYPVFTGHFLVEDLMEPRQSLDVHARVQGTSYILEKTLGDFAYTQRITKLKVRDSYVHRQDMRHFDSDPARMEAARQALEDTLGMLE